jgi:hypothetical protein
MYVSLKEALYQLKQLCEAHKQVNSYYHGKNLLELYSSNEIIHTTVLTTVQNATFEPNFINVTIQLVCVDKILKGEENFNDIESNTLSIVGDLINYINTDTSWRYAKIVTNPTAVKLVDRTKDVADGWSASMTFRLLKDNGTCDLPIDGITPIPSCLPVTVTDSDGVTIYEVVSGGSFACTPAVTPVGIAYQRPQLSGQTTSYQTYDEAWQLANGTYDYTPPAYPVSYAQLDTFTTLINNNAFGNKNRFTDENGLQVFGNAYAIDHLTGLGWSVSVGSGIFTTALNNANSSTASGFSDWRLANRSESESILKHQGGRLNYSPFNNFINSTFHTSTGGYQNPTIRNYQTGIRTGAITDSVHTNSIYYYIVRNHYT